MADTTKRVYWDACAWIGFINAEKEKITALRTVWENAKRGKYEIWTSTFSYLEVMHGINKAGQPYSPEEYDVVLYELFEQPHVERVQVDVEVAKLARSVKRKYHPTLASRADAIHLATALYWNCEELHTYDGGHLLPLNGKIARRDGIILTIIVPGITPPPGGLFSNMNPSLPPPETGEIPSDETGSTSGESNQTDRRDLTSENQ